MSDYPDHIRVAQKLQQQQAEIDRLRKLAEAAERRLRPLHMPVVASRHDGRWGVYCWLCSEEAGDYVYPCRQRRDRVAGWPPPVLDDMQRGELTARLAAAEACLAEVRELVPATPGGSGYRTCYDLAADIRRALDTDHAEEH